LSEEVKGRRILEDDEYAKLYLPLGGYIAVERDGLPDKIGELFIPIEATNVAMKSSTTGVVIAKSHCKVFENEFEKYIMDHIQEGDRIGFTMLTPILSPSPPVVEWEGRGEYKKYGQKYVTLHVVDVLGFFANTPEEKAELKARFNTDETWQH